MRQCASGSVSQPGYLALLLHAHLPFVRHPEREKFLEESWLFEAITESYLPLLQILQGWEHDGLPARLTLTLTPTLCSMLLDPLLQERYQRHLKALTGLAEKEILRTRNEPEFNRLADFYLKRLSALSDLYLNCEGDLVGAFRRLQNGGRLEIIGCAASHALLPLLQHPPSVRAQILTGCSHYRACFGRDPSGFWLPECAYQAGVEPALAEAGVSWFVTESQGILHANPQPRRGVFAPIHTPLGLAAFGRDQASSKQVWSRQHGYPGDPRYRDFYRDIGFDLDLDYVQACLPTPEIRGFTGIKYHRVTGKEGAKEIYDRAAALQAAADHARHFLESRIEQIRQVSGLLDQPPILLAPYDAELFGHWWYEGPEFLDHLVRAAAIGPTPLKMLTPGDYLQRHPAGQLAQPAASSWGESGDWRVWLNETNAWIYPHLRVAQQRMTQLAQQFPSPPPLEKRALQQAARELLLAQSSDWAFLLRTGTSPDYGRKRVTDHLFRFTVLHEQLTGAGVNERWLEKIESRDNLFQEVDPQLWK
jgi:1,4-alpha-glucan branching enzyme